MTYSAGTAPRGPVPPTTELTEADVEAYITNGPLDLALGTTVNSLPILAEGDPGTLSGLACQRR